MFKKIKSLFLSELLWKKIISYFLLFLFFFLTRNFFMLFFVSFLFAYLFYELSKFISKKIKSKIKKQNKLINTLTSINFLASGLYTIFLLWFLFFISHLIPLIITELTNLSKHIPIIADYIKQIINSLMHVKQAKEVVSSDIDKLMNEKNIEIIVNIINHLKIFGWNLLKRLIAFILSYFFIIDRKKLHKYLEKIKNWSFKFLYDEYSFLFKKISKWFLLIFKAQSKIAIINTILTYIWINIISFIIWQQIPYLGLLTFIVFIFSFIPVLWVIISSIPIILIVYNIAWFWWVVYVISMILIIHSIEAYILNPRFISEEVDLPVSLTFLILLIWEHIFWPIWLIISVPLFYIFTEIIWDLDKTITKID